MPNELMKHQLMHIILGIRCIYTAVKSISQNRSWTILRQYDNQYFVFYALYVVINTFICLQNLITNWAKLFVELFQKYSPSDLKLPKLHNWRYHIIASIKEYGAINGFTTETYETLHKDAVKKPYRASNKRQPTDQMIKTVGFDSMTHSSSITVHNKLTLFFYTMQVYRNVTLKYLRQHTVVSRRQQKTPMNGLLGTFFLKDFDTFFDNYKSKNALANEALLAIDNFISTLNKFFDLCDGLTEEMVGETKISWYSYTNISSSGDYIRAKVYIIMSRHLAMCRSI